MLKKCMLNLSGLTLLIIIVSGYNENQDVIAINKQFYRYVPQINEAYSVTQQIYPYAAKRFKKIKSNNFFIDQVKKSAGKPATVMSHTYKSQKSDIDIDTDPDREGNQFHRQNSSFKKNNKSSQKRPALFYILLIDGILAALVLGLIICYCRTNKLDQLNNNLRRNKEARLEQQNSLSGQINNQNTSLASNPVKRQSDQSSSQEDIDSNNSD